MLSIFMAFFHPVPLGCREFMMSNISLIIWMNSIVASQSLNSGQPQSFKVCKARATDRLNNCAAKLTLNQGVRNIESYNSLS